MEPCRDKASDRLEARQQFRPALLQYPQIMPRTDQNRAARLAAKRGLGRLGIPRIYLYSWAYGTADELAGWVAISDRRQELPPVEARLRHSPFRPCNTSDKEASRAR
jgi:hypothetical protein